MRIRSRVILKILAITIPCIVACSNEPPTAAPGNLQGNCVGTVKDAGGSPVACASLILVPEGYSPLSTANGSGIDSTTSDKYGRYAFLEAAPGSYNMLAKSNGLYAMRQQVRVSADARVILDDEILLAPGSLSGTVHLQGTSDHGKAIILFMGTNIFAMPFDSSGAFTVAALAQGSYTLRLLTAENDYASAETSIAVTSGMHTELPCIELEKKFVPVIDSLSVVYDPLMIKAVLTWPPLDTLKIMHYAVYCNRSENLNPIAIIDRSTTRRSFDLFASPIDTFRYQISAIGIDGVEGPSTAGKPFVKFSAFALDALDTIAAAVSLDGAKDMRFDRRGNIFVFCQDQVIKLDSNGTFLGKCVLNPDSSGAYRSISFGQMRIDSAGNIYTLVEYRLSSTSRISRRLIKINHDMTPVRELSIDSAGWGNRSSIAISPAGAVLLYVSHYTPYNDTVGYATHWCIYDTQFAVKRTDSTAENLWIVTSVAYNDTSVCFINDDFRGNYRIVYFDPEFNEISSPVNLDYRNNFQELSPFVPPGYSPASGFYLVSKDLFAAEYWAPESCPPLLLFFDDHLQAIARVPTDRINTDFSLDFDCSGNIYGISNIDKNTILKWPVAKVLKAPPQYHLPGNSP